MSLNAAATSASSSLDPALTCTPTSPPAIRLAASRNRRSGRTTIPAMMRENSETMSTMIADDNTRFWVNSSTGANASSLSISATMIQL
jgi:hypothetical protein